MAVGQARPSPQHRTAPLPLPRPISNHPAPYPHPCPHGTTTGIQEAKEGGRLLKEAGFTFDKAYTSLLRRAIKTCWLVLEEVRDCVRVCVRTVVVLLD